MLTDDYTLAAFLSQNLPDEEREEMLLLLTTDEELREIMAMATEALLSASSDTDAINAILV